MSMSESGKAYFESVAERWDDIRAGYFGEEVRSAALAHGYLRSEHVVADVGAGTGYIAAALAPLVKHVHVVDGSQPMLDVAKQNLQEHANVSFHLSDGERLPLPDASLDAVFANMYLHHCPDPAAAIQEMARLLSPGGRLVITDMDQHEHEWMRAEMADEWLGFPRTDVRKWLREAGLVNVLVDCSGESCCATSTQKPGEKAKISVFVASGTRRIQVREEVKARYGATAARGFPGDSCCGPDVDVAAPADVIPLATACCAAPTGATKATPVACCTPSGAQSVYPDAPDGASFIWDTGYSAEQLTGVPVEAQALALGCGNPTALTSLRPGETVVDIGSGGGVDAFVAVRRVGPTGRVIGVDMTPAMLERARDSAARAGVSNVDFREGTADSLPVDDGSADVVMSNCVINLCEDKGQVFEEAHRVLREGGRLAVSDTVASGPLPNSLRYDSQGWGACVSGALPETEYLDLVRAAGFRDVRGVRSLSHGTVAGVELYSLSVTGVK